MRHLREVECFLIRDGAEPSLEKLAQMKMSERGKKGESKNSAFKNCEIVSPLLEFKFW